MILEIDNDEWEHLNKILGGPYENVTRVLGSGLTGEGRLRLLAKVQAIKPPRIYNPSTQGDGQ